MSKSIFQRSISAFGVVMVVSTITLVGLVAFQFLNAQDNTEVAKAPTTSTEKKVAQAEPAPIVTAADIDAATAQLDVSELDALDAELNTEFDF